MTGSTDQRLLGDFEFYRDNADEWRWRKFDSQERIIATAHEGYHNKSDCEANARRFGYQGQWKGENDRWEPLTNYAGPDNELRFWWRRTARNNEIVGKSHKGFKQMKQAELNARQNGFTGNSL